MPLTATLIGFIRGPQLSTSCQSGTVQVFCKSSECCCMGSRAIYFHIHNIYIFRTQFALFALDIITVYILFLQLSFLGIKYLMIVFIKTTNGVHVLLNLVLLKYLITEALKYLSSIKPFEVPAIRNFGVLVSSNESFECLTSAKIFEGTWL